MTTLAVTSVSSLRCHISTCFRIGSKFRCIRSTPTEMQSMSENDFGCFASTGVNTPETMFPSSDPRKLDFPEADFWPGITSDLPVMLEQSGDDRLVFHHVVHRKPSSRSYGK